MSKEKIVINATEGASLEELEKTRRAIERANKATTSKNDVLDYVKNYGSREIIGRLKAKGVV